MQIYINGRFLTQRTTGVQRYGRETLMALDELLLEQSSGEPQWSLLVPPDAEAPSLQAIDVRRVGRLRGHAWEQLELAIAARRGLLWSFGPTGPLLVRRQVVTMHDAAVYRVPEGFSTQFRAVYSLFMPILARSTPLTMTVSEFSKAELGRTIGLRPERCCVSGEGHEHVFRARADTRILAKHGLRPRRYVLAVSSVTPYKNFELVARALQLLGNADFQVVVAGATNERVFGELGTQSLRQLKLVGYVSDDELRALYENAGLFVFPSRYEGFGLPPLEAMALGCPVIAARAAAIPEVCGDGARYFSPDDPAELAQLVQSLMTQPGELDRLRKHGRAQVERHRWAAAARAHLQAAQRVLGEATVMSLGDPRNRRPAQESTAHTRPVR
jgi:glycosyltransferase involved in cell wall biosynthesis